MRQLRVVPFAVLVIAVACGGSDRSSPSPTSPAPIPAVDTCNSIGGTASTSATGILNGSGCSADRSSVVLLNLRNSDNSTLGSCSGTIIAPRAVLTAAHCLDEAAAVAAVWLGSGEEIVAQSFAFYPNFRFNTPGSFDVGIVAMAQDLPRNPVPILTSREARIGETAIIAGWGKDQSSVPATLRAGSTKLSAVSGNLIETLYAPPSSSICQGDSGGPLLLSESGAWAIGGITSATSASVCNTGTNFYQAVRNATVRDFILQHVPNALQR